MLPETKKHLELGLELDFLQKELVFLNSRGIYDPKIAFSTQNSVPMQIIVGVGHICSFSKEPGFQIISWGLRPQIPATISLPQ